MSAVVERHLAAAEDALAHASRDGGSGARRRLAALDAVLLEALRRAEAAPDGSPAAPRGRGRWQEEALSSAARAWERSRMC